MTFWLRVFADLIPLLASVTLIVAGSYCPLLYRNQAALVAFSVVVVLFSVGFSLIWVKL